MNDFSEKDTDLLIKLINKELELYEMYLSEVTSQTEYINFDDDEGLTASIHEQNRISKKIDELHKQTAPLLKKYRASELSKKSSEPGEKCPIERAISRIKVILAESSELNKQNLKSAEEKKAEYSEHISKLGKDKKGLSGYTHIITETSDLFDKKQ